MALGEGGVGVVRLGVFVMLYVRERRGVSRIVTRLVLKVFFGAILFPYERFGEECPTRSINH